MALVLRKAVLPRNVSLLKCIKGRSLASSANKNTPAPLSTAVRNRSLKSKARVFENVKIEQAKQLPTVRESRDPKRTVRLRYIMSCPNLVPESRIQPRIRHSSHPRTMPLFCATIHTPQAFVRSFSHSTFCPPSLLRADGSQINSARANSSKVGGGKDKGSSCPCPCPFPCGPCGCPSGCGCLPPPCNQPPRCIQYMTGYYYYPYGFWFCGPYHVSGTCAPCGCGPCGPCPSPPPCPPCPPPCPPSPCPPPCCMCSHPATVLNEMADIKPAEKSSPNLTQPPKAKSPPCAPNTNRSGISKFFPFGTVVQPMDLSTNGNNIKCRRPSTMSSMASPYSTQARHKQENTWPELKPKFNSNNYYARSNKTRTAFERSMAECKKSRSPIRRRRAANRKYILYEACPVLDKPREIMSQEQRDRPNFRPGVFDYKSVPKYRSPYPQPFYDFGFKAYES